MWALAFSFVALVPGDIVAHLSGSVFGYGGYYVQQKLFFNGTNRHKSRIYRKTAILILEGKC